MAIAMIGAKEIPVREGSGGIETHVEELAARLVDKGHRVTAYVRCRQKCPIEHRGIKLVEVPTVDRRGVGTLWRVFVSTVKSLLKSFDVYHFHGVGAAPFAVLPRLLRPRARVVVTFHSIDRRHGQWGRWARAYLHFGEWAALKFPHRTVAVSRSIQKYCDGTYRAGTFYIPNGATVGQRPGSGELARWDLQKNEYILTVGRLVALKGFHYLIEAYRRLDTAKKLVIVGGDADSGEYADYLRWQASGNSDIVFTGFQSGRTLQQLIANAYLYVHPSEVEGLSVSILEAMAAGRCVLTSNIPENREPLDHSGLTFVSADVEDLYNQLRSLLNHPDVVAERGARGAKWIAQEYSWDRVAAMTETMYLDL